MAGSLTGHLRRGLLNQRWSHQHDGTEDRWTAPDGNAEVRVDAPPGTNLRVVEARRGDNSLLLRTTGDTGEILRGLADMNFIPQEVADEAA
jgi:hypothetical protein